ncbi:unannotated protein [freshwater metagenome]|uniref:Unannotated protein n=1 Tax=freshwater metagenome TaxID=449393 RepID=A0A6J7J7J5_9ZZZZ
MDPEPAAGDEAPPDDVGDARGEHQHGQRDLDRHGLEAPRGGGAGGEPARRGDGHRVVDGLPRGEPDEEQRDEGDAGDGQVDQRGDAGGVAHLRGDGLLLHAARLAEEHAARGATGRGGDRDEQDDDADAADPVGQRAPQEDGVGLPVDLDERRGARGGDAGGALEDRVGDPRERAGEQQRDRGEEARGHPGQSGGHEAVASRGRRHRPPDPRLAQEQREDGRRGGRGAERPDGPAVGDHGGDRADQAGDGQGDRAGRQGAAGQRPDAGPDAWPAGAPQPPPEAAGVGGDVAHRSSTAPSFCAPLPVASTSAMSPCS